MSLDHHHRPASRMGGIKVVALILLGALVFSLTGLFLHSHHHLETATRLHAETLGHELNVGSKWDIIFDIAKKSGDGTEFLALLRTAGLANDGVDALACQQVKGHSGAHLGGPLDTGDDEEDYKGDDKQGQVGGFYDGGEAAGAGDGGDEEDVVMAGRLADKAAQQKQQVSKVGVSKNVRGKAGAVSVDGFEYNDEEEGRKGGKEGEKGEGAKRLGQYEYGETDDEIGTGQGAGAQTETGLVHQRSQRVDPQDPALQPIDGGPPPMSVKLAHSVAVNDTVIVTWANYALWDFVQSWVRHARRQGYTNFIVGAMDKEIGRALVAWGVPSFAMYDLNKNHSGVGTDHLAWGGEGFHKMGRQKISLAQLFLSTKLNLLLVDVDAVILGDVLTFFDRYPEADVLVSSDMLRTTLEPGDTGLELPADAGAPMNIGIMYFRYNSETQRFVDTWLDAINKDDKYWDQNAFNDLARAGWDPRMKLHPSNPRVFMGFNGSLSVGVLPVASFSGGHTFFIQKLYEVQQVQPLMVHCTFQYGANMGKRNRMREFMIFDDDDSYWTGDKYVSVWVTKAPSMSPNDFAKLNYTQKKAYNKKGVFQQLDALYAGVGLAAMFNRSLVMPKLACYCDRYWAPLEDCRIPGALQERLPFMCPMDYVIDPIGLADDASPLKVRWREHSFFENPRCPDAVRASKLTIYTSPKVKVPTEKWVVQDGGHVLVLPTGLSEAKLRAALTPYEHFKHFWFHDAPATFAAGFSDGDLKQAYRQRVLRLGPILQPDSM